MKLLLLTKRQKFELKRMLLDLKIYYNKCAEDNKKNDKLSNAYKKNVKRTEDMLFKIL